MNFDILTSISSFHYMYVLNLWGQIFSCGLFHVCFNVLSFHITVYEHTVKKKNQQPRSVIYILDWNCILCVTIALASDPAHAEKRMHL